jgi:MFS family permease
MFNNSINHKNQKGSVKTTTIKFESFCNILFRLYFHQGMWSTSFYLGNFLGPTVSGFLVEAYGFRNSTIVFFSLLIVILVVDVFELAYNVRLKRSAKNVNYEELK